MTDDTETTDGRRRRSQDSRARIVKAMLDLTAAGQVSVSAESVADAARVGLRTVFRHFRDMDSLYREMSLAIEVEVRGLQRPFRSSDWREQVMEMIDLRAAVFEKITPFKVAESAHRHRSRFLEGDGQKLTLALREIMRSVLPAAVAQDGLTFEALDMVMSFEAWQRLRREQGLSVEAARTLVGRMAKKLIG